MSGFGFLEGTDDLAFGQVGGFQNVVHLVPVGDTLMALCGLEMPYLLGIISTVVWDDRACNRCKAVAEEEGLSWTE